jgi:hypothetical protein
MGGAHHRRHLVGAASLEPGHRREGLTAVYHQALVRRCGPAADVIRLQLARGGRRKGRVMTPWRIAVSAS